MPYAFGETEFAVGSVIGYRRWGVSAEGMLAPLSFRNHFWVPGENHAECYGTPDSELIPEEIRQDWSARDAFVREWRGNHGLPNCRHGYYAYFAADKRDNSMASQPSIAGVIEGYGEVVIGTLGFRAMKARILALSIEPFLGIWEIKPEFVEKISNNYPGIPIFGSTERMNAEYLPGNEEYTQRESKLKW